MAILDAILQGQREPRQLAALCHGGVRAPQETVIQSLVGNYRSEHLFTLRQSLSAYRHYQQMLADCDHQIEQHLRQLKDNTDPGGSPLAPAPQASKRRKNQFHFDMRQELYRILGTDLTAVPGISSLTAHVILAEIGPDLSRFPSSTAFASWLTLCPANNKSGGKVLSSRTRKSNSRVSLALRLAAQTLHKSQSYLGAYYRRMRARLGAPQAITAAAHKLARILYHLLTTRTAYDESVFAREEKKQAVRHENRLRKQAKTMGFNLVPISA
jgi:transposase